MNKKILNMDIERKIKSIEKKVKKYNESSLQNKSTEKNKLLEENIKKYLNQLDELEKILDNPSSIKRKNNNFEKIHGKMEEIVNMDTNKMSITEKIKTSLELYQLLKLGELHIANNKIEEIIVE